MSAHFKFTSRKLYYDLPQAAWGYYDTGGFFMPVICDMFMYDFLGADQWTPARITVSDRGPGRKIFVKYVVDDDHFGTQVIWRRGNKHEWHDTFSAANRLIRLMKLKPGRERRIIVNLVQ